MVTYCKEESLKCNLPLFAAFVVLHNYSGNSVGVSKHLLCVGVPKNLYLWVGGYSLPHCNRCPQLVSSYNKIDLAAERCKVGCLFAGCISTADNGYNPLSVEESVAGCAGRDAHTLKLLLAWQTKIFCGGACCYDERLCQILFVAIHHNFEGSLLKIALCNGAVTHVGAKVYCLLPHLTHHLCGIYAIWVSRKILNSCCCSQLSARLHALKKKRGQIGSGSIYGSCVTCRSAAYYETFYSIHFYKVVLVCKVNNFFLIAISALYPQTSINEPAHRDKSITHQIPPIEATSVRSSRLL